MGGLQLAWEMLACDSSGFQAMEGGLWNWWKLGRSRVLTVAAGIGLRIWEYGPGYGNQVGGS